MPSSSLNLSDLDGSNGFVINGINRWDNLGFSVSSAGDINGDGIDDLIIGAPYYSLSPSPYAAPGTSYVVFGGTDIGLGGSFDLSTLDGRNGFVINNSIQPYVRLGYSVSRTGDINGDGFDDLIIGAPGKPFLGGIRGGSPYVVFGSSDVGSGGSFDLSTLDGSNGFVLDRAIVYSVSSAGDINGDGIDDLSIGEPVLYGTGGTSYVVFGGTDVGADGRLNLLSLNSSNGFQINYYGLGDGTTHSVSGAGDINGDGIDDLIIGVPSMAAIYPQGRSSVSYVVFGGTNVGADGNFDISSLDGSNGFVINGLEPLDNLGWSVSSAGDINDDGIDDLIIGAPGYNLSGFQNNSSKSYVLFGGTTIGADGSFDLSTLDGSNGFVINGINSGDYSGWSVSAAGDINGDSIADLIIGAPKADPNGSNSGSTYIVFGGAGVGAGGRFDLSSLDGKNGFALNGIAAGDGSGFSVSGAGDVNGDGIDDVIIGALAANTSYIVFGSAVSPSDPTPVDEAVNPTAVNDRRFTTLNTPVALNVIANDTDANGNPLQISSFDTISTQGGSIALNDNGTTDDLSDDLLVYTPASDLLGFDSFSYTIDNGIGGTATATVNVAVFSQQGTFGNDTLTGSSVGDFIRGGAGDDLVDGTEGNDKLLGNWGNDILVGGEGNDLLAGGFGNDLLVGGGGSDRFLLVSSLETDTIADFESGVDAIALFGGLTFGQLDVTQSESDTLISVAGTGEVLATLTGVQANVLTAADFTTL